MKTYKALILFLALISSSALPPEWQQMSVLPLPDFKKSAEVNAYEYQKFIEHSDSRLVEYKKYFKKYAYEFQIPWALIAAVAYQESKWNENVTSPTGVKGLMQLTLKTAEHIGVNDRTDPIQSIRGGAYYLKYLYDKTPTKLNPTQRWIFALVAYNIGWGHLQDARELTLALSKNPYLWDDFKSILPLLEVKLYYSYLPLGYARGQEAVTFVDKVISYYTLLNSDSEIQLSKSE